VKPEAKMGRPPKATGEEFVLKSFKVPPDLWAEFVALVPDKERSEMMRSYMRKEIARRKKK
jgi:hypothetical protein